MEPQAELVILVEAVADGSQSMMSITTPLLGVEAFVSRLTEETEQMGGRIVHVWMKAIGGHAA
jgi:hypothetical protein